MTKPRVFATVGLGFSDTIRAGRAMPILTLAAVIVSGGNALAEWMFGLSQSDAALTGKVLLAQLVGGVAYVILLAPVQIAIVRFVVLDEVTRGYTLDSNSHRFQLFCAWSIVLFMLAFAVSILTRVHGFEGEIGTALDWSLMIAALALSIGMALLFPAIAVDAPGATLQNAFADLRGSFWRAVGIFVVTAIPTLAVFLAGMIAILEIAKIDGYEAIGWLMMLSLELLWTAIAARLFLALADRLRSPAAP